MIFPVNNFTVIESIYGRFIVNRHCQFQADALIKTGIPHIQPELQGILGICNTLPLNCVVVDAGANIGLVAIPIAQSIKEKGGIVHAFEVQRMLFNALCGSVALNDLEHLYVYHKGLGSKRSTAQMPIPNYGQPQDFGLMSLVTPPEGSRHETVEMVAIDDVGLPRLDFLKIDVEGMEIDVLKGAQKLIREYKPWCWIEYWKVDRELLKKQFDGLEYKFYRIDQLNMLAAPTERVKAGEITIAAAEM